MDKNQINARRDSFERRRHRISNALEGLENLRKHFVNDFSYETLQSLPMGKYVTGGGRTGTFCYRIERELKGLGNITGIPATKFGVYFNNKLNDYKAVRRWGGTPQGAYEEVRTSIIELLDAGRNHEEREILDSSLSPVFKGKILSTYFPEKYLNVFSEQHLNHYVKALDIQHSCMDNEVEKRLRLMRYKNQDPLMTRWSNQEFMIFLYTELGKELIKDMNRWLMDHLVQQL